MRLSPIALLPLLALVACDAETSTGHGSGSCGPAVTKAAAPRALLEATCAAQEACGEIPAGVMSACVDLYVGWGYDQLYASLLDDPLIAYDSAAMGCCLQDLATRPCIGAEQDPASCARALRGTLANGAPCGENIHCAAGACIDGLCAQRPGADEPCEDVCAENLTCTWEWEELEGDNGICRPFPAEGEPCTPGETDCGPGLACEASLDDETDTGVCVPPAAGGERCTESVPCAPPDLYCAHNESGPDEGTCLPRVSAGGACSYEAGFDDDSGCILGLVCRFEDSTDPTGTCVALPGEGESCAELGRCAWGFRCTGRDEVCKRPLFRGEPCNVEENLCYSGACIDGVCGEDDRE